MKAKKILIAGLVIVVGAILAVVLNANRPTTPVVVPIVARESASSTAPPQEILSASKSPASETTAAVQALPANPVKSNVAIKAPVRANTSQANQPLMINGYTVQDPTARLALSFVGADPDADAYWISAINNPNLPSEERKDLIEDLNEDGLSDPQHPGPQDMPLILARIRLIEALAPNAMDLVNADALGEAYGDLAGMLNGQPPQ
jgi:hypothetical protein